MEEEEDHVEEIHRIRKAIMKEFGGDLHAYGRYLMAEQGKDGRKLVSFEKKRPAKPRGAGKRKKAGV